MPPLQHAKLSASSAHRWLNCPGSVEFSSFYPSRDTFYTKEGSLAHALAEVLLKKAIGIDATTTKDVNKVVRRVKQFYEVGTNAEGAEKFTKEMRTFIKDYVDWVLEEFNAGRKQDPNTLILLETKFDLEPYIPEGFGTADVTLLYGDTLHIIDLKYGRGVLVDAYDVDEAPNTKGGVDKRTVLHLDPRLAPVKAAVLPLSKKPDLQNVAQKLAADLRQHEWMIDYDEAGAIGRRYRREDEIGTPLCVTVDFDTLEDQAVTIRERDTMQQERVSLDKVADYVAERIGEKRVSVPQMPESMGGEAWPDSVHIAEAGGLY